MNASCLRILLAEDDLLVAADLEACLREAGHEVLSVEARGDSTLTAARLLQPDVVVLNVRLRGPIDGRAVATALRQGHPLPVPVVFVTALADRAVLQRLQATAPLAVLAKPLVGQHLCQALSQAMSSTWR